MKLVKRLVPAGACLALAAFWPLAATAGDQTHVVKFKAGATSATIKGSLTGYDGVKYILGAAQGQAMSVIFSPDNASCSFNVLPPGSQEAIFIGSTSGNEYSGNLQASGDYVIQAYLMRNAARRNEVCAYSLTVEISAGSPSPDMERTDDALVPGTQFHATGDIPCARAAGQPMASCKFGVVRQGEGTAQLTVFWPDGGNRVLFFDKGKLLNADLSQADGDAKVSSERQSDLTTARVGDQRFEIPDMVIYGD